MTSPATALASAWLNVAAGFDLSVPSTPADPHFADTHRVAVFEAYASVQEA